MLKIPWFSLLPLITGRNLQNKRAHIAHYQPEYGTFLDNTIELFEPKIIKNKHRSGRGLFQEEIPGDYVDLSGLGQSPMETPQELPSDTQPGFDALLRKIAEETYQEMNDYNFHDNELKKYVEDQHSFRYNNWELPEKEESPGESIMTDPIFFIDEDLNNSRNYETVRGLADFFGADYLI